MLEASERPLAQASIGEEMNLALRLASDGRSVQLITRHSAGAGQVFALSGMERRVGKGRAEVSSLNPRISSFNAVAELTFSGTSWWNGLQGNARLAVEPLRALRLGEVSRCWRMSSSAWLSLGTGTRFMREGLREEVEPKDESIDGRLSLLYMREVDSAHPSIEGLGVIGVEGVLAAEDTPESESDGIEEKETLPSEDLSELVLGLRPIPRGESWQAASSWMPKVTCISSAISAMVCMVQSQWGPIELTKNQRTTTLTIALRLAGPTPWKIATTLCAGLFQSGPNWDEVRSRRSTGCANWQEAESRRHQHCSSVNVLGTHLVPSDSKPLIDCHIERRTVAISR